MLYIDKKKSRYTYPVILQGPILQINLVGDHFDKAFAHSNTKYVSVQKHNGSLLTFVFVEFDMKALQALADSELKDGGDNRLNAWSIAQGICDTMGLTNVLDFHLHENGMHIADKKPAPAVSLN